MQHTRQWLITRLVSPTPLTPGQPLAAVATHCAQSIARSAGMAVRSAVSAPGARATAATKAKAAARELATHGLALTLEGQGVLAVDCRAPCNLQVLSGDAWVTAEGNFRDIIVEPRSSLPLARGARYSLSPLHGTVTFVVAGCGLANVQFSVADVGGARTLVVAAIVSARQRFVDALRARIAAFESVLWFPRRLRSHA